MKHIAVSLAIVIALLLYVSTIAREEETIEFYYYVDNFTMEINLPMPKKYTNVTVEEAILMRRSVRDYKDEPISLENLSLILWSAYGITDPKYEFRASPSAGATYPLELYVVIGEKGVVVNKTYLKSGIYKYDVYRHKIFLIKEGDFRKELARASLDQEWVEKAPVNLVVTAIFERTTRIYGERGETRYVPMEVGHLGQNVYLISTALGYGSVVVGAFYDEWVRKIIGAGKNEVPMYIIPIGVPKEKRKIDFKDLWNYFEVKRKKQ